MKTENKQYRLKRWYPSLAISWRTGDRYEYDAGRRVMTNISNVKNGLAMPKEMVVKEQEIHPDFWELIEEEKPKPLFITDDGVELFDKADKLFIVNKECYKKESKISNIYDKTNRKDFKYFFHESNADEYIWKNKRVFSYEDMMKAKHSIILTDEDIEKAAKERVNGTNQEFIDNMNYAREYLKEKIDGRCPKCGGELEYSHIDMVLLSNPPQRQINCTECAYVGYLTI